MVPKTFRCWGEKTAPCRGCTERVAEPNCHGRNEDGSFRCERYGAFVDENERAKKQRKDWVDADDALSDVRRRKWRP